MAEKEERISIELLKDNFCDSCNNIGKLKNCCCYEKQEYDERYKNSLSRQEVISKMAKALCNWYYHECSECALRDKPKECKALLKDADFYEQAESELNALLEEVE